MLKAAGLPLRCWCIKSVIKEGRLACSSNVVIRGKG